MSSARIEEKENEEEAEKFESIKETNLPLHDSGATAHVLLDSGGPTDIRSQGNNEIVVAELKEKLLSIGALQQQQIVNDIRPSHPADRLALTYARATSHVQTKQRAKEHRSRITGGGDRYQTVDISNGYLHLPVREETIVE